MKKVFLKECKYMEKKVIKHIKDYLNDFSSDDKSDQEYMSFDKYLNWLLLSLFIINQYCTSKVMLQKMCVQNKWEAAF